MAAEDWRPAAGLDALRLRAALNARIRAFFAARGVLEVETPILSAAGSKLAKAQELGVEIWDEAKLRAFLAETDVAS